MRVRAVPCAWSRLTFLLGSQLLEDAAVLVFLEKEIEGFAQRHKDYTEDKFVEILVKYVLANRQMCAV